MSANLAEIFTPVLRADIWAGAFCVSLLAAAALVAMSGEARERMPGGWRRTMLAVSCEQGVFMFVGFGLFVSGALAEIFLRLGMAEPLTVFVSMIGTVALASLPIVLLKRIRTIADAQADLKLATWAAAQDAWWGMFWKNTPKPAGSGRALVGSPGGDVVVSL